MQLSMFSLSWDRSATKDAFSSSRRPHTVHILVFYFWIHDSPDTIPHIESHAFQRDIDIAIAKNLNDRQTPKYTAYSGNCPPQWIDWCQVFKVLRVYYCLKITRHLITMHVLFISFPFCFHTRFVLSKFHSHILLFSDVIVKHSTWLLNSCCLLFENLIPQRKTTSLVNIVFGDHMRNPCGKKILLYVTHG